MVDDMRMLHTAINGLLQQGSLPLLGPLKSSLAGRLNVEGLHADETGTFIEDEDQDMEEQTNSLCAQSEDLVEPLSQAPISSLHEITRLRSANANGAVSSAPMTAQPGAQEPQDLITEGTLQRNDADRLVKRFLERTDYYLYGITSRFEDLDSVRRASPLLFVAICTVSALHEHGGEQLYRVCSARLRKLVSDFMFKKHVNLYDFQGLCIASFWLSDLSWSVSGLAIRRAIEFQLDKSYEIAIGASQLDDRFSNSLGLKDQEDVLSCLRVWYLFYICDHHLSILYGRPSSFGNPSSVQGWRKYLRAVPSSSTDTRLSSQLELLSILEKVTYMFGSYGDSRISGIFKKKLEEFDLEVDRWHGLWGARYRTQRDIERQIGAFPRKNLRLHYHFAKLFIGSLVFRGLSSNPVDDPIPMEFLDLAHGAVESARSTIELITTDPDLKAGLVGLPHYNHTMIAYACTFLLKVATKYHRHLDMDQDEAFDHVSQAAETCQSIQCTRYHLVSWMGAGLAKFLENCRKLAERQSDASADGRGRETTVSPTLSTRKAKALSRAMPSNDAWDSARRVAEAFPTSLQGFMDGNYNFPQDAVDMDSMETLGLDILEGSDLAWDSFLPSFNFEHMGFSLL
ncbi:uncharacterized protein CCOS01_03704 [Colletotrichum costaricense]|uniref:Transcription factor domain-containing protein n=1 Tax=Colletotrichum costaricense TaxID=1209916 RepID=A0AAJ0E471_9PEZI|nr:uncharacterized protein CCOS01_03704 [Colletotrichum costaricense]KAK1534952.1 hypothetical protein CCOS01_03704 [Colletotrichum costaricense]